MSNLQILATMFYLAVMTACGYSIAREGVAQGWAWGAGCVQLCRWRVVWQSYEFRPNKIYFRAAIVAA